MNTAAITASRRVAAYLRSFELSRGRRADIIDRARGRDLRASDLRLVLEALTSATEDVSAECRDEDFVAPRSPNAEAEARSDCSCWPTPVERHTTYGDATEPGSTMEPNPECPIHQPEVNPLPCGCHCAGNNPACGGAHQPCFRACGEHVCL